MISAQVGPRVGGLVRARRRLRAVATPAPAPSPAARRASADARAARRRPFHAAGARPLEAGAHRLVVSRRGEELAAAAFDVPPPRPRPLPWARLPAPRRAALLGWLDGCGATCVVDRSCKVELPLPRAAPAPPATAPALGELAAAVDAARGAVLVLPGFVDAAEAARIVAAASERGAMGPAREERGGGAAAAAARTNTCGRLDGAACPGLVATALALFPGCAPDRVEVQVVRYGAGERYDNHHDVVARGPDGAWRRAASIFVVLQAADAGGATAFKRLRPRDVHVARAGWRGGGAPDLGPCDRASSPAGPLAPGVDIAARPGDGLLWHNVDEWGRRDERVEHAPRRAGPRARAPGRGRPAARAPGRAARTAAPRSPAPRRRGAPSARASSGASTSGSGPQKGDSTSLQRECFARARPGKSIYASRALPRDDRSFKNQPKRVERGRDGSL